MKNRGSSEGGIKSKEIVLGAENMLEGSILTHGFRGNSESADLRKVIATGGVLSPSLQGREKGGRWKYDAPWDWKRICFRARRGPNDISHI